MKICRSRLLELILGAFILFAAGCTEVPPQTAGEPSPPAKSGYREGYLRAVIKEAGSTGERELEIEFARTDVRVE